MRLIVCLAVAGLGWVGPALAGPTTYRLHDGLTAFIANTDGRALTLTLDVRDLNLVESGPREVLVKVYDPRGRPLIREIIPDDGIHTPACQFPVAAWDHEAWYYAWCHMQGAAPMMRWSAFSAPERLASVPKRTFTYRLPAGPGGVYRLLLVGATDHYVTLHLDPPVPYGVSGHPDWLHGHGDLYRQRFVFVPRGTRGLHVTLAEYDQPRQRRLKVTAPDGRVLFEGDAAAGFTKATVDFDRSGQYDDQLLRLEVSAGGGDYLLGLKLRRDKDAEVTYRGELAVAAVLADDEATARAVRGGAIYQDGRVFWQPFQVRLHDWLKSIPAADFEVKDAHGKPVLPAPPHPAGGRGAAATLPTRPGFLPLNGPYWGSPLCDRIMHHYPAHRNRAALNVALRDLASGLRSIGPNDHVAVAVGGPFANMAYEFGNYAWHYWRPAWRILQQSDAPAEVKDIVREAFLLCGDRLAFCRSWERINGNSFAQVLSALRYCSEATGDPLHRQLFETYWQRFVSGGWGERVGVGPSGGVQENFAYDHHYGSYILTTWQSIIADLADDRFRQVHERLRTLYSYTLAAEDIPAGPWSSRTPYYPHWQIETDGPFAWKGLPGPDFTVSVNDGNEWFAARRKGYYALTYHGRLTPKWIGHAFAGQIGYGGGMLCQLHVMGQGPVVASTLNGGYGEKMHPSQWPNFHIHSLVGRTADGKPLVTADSEHVNARLVGQVVSSSAEVRDSSVQVFRRYTFEADAIGCEVRLKETSYNELLGLWIPNPMRGQVVEAFEMLPFVAQQPRRPGQKSALPTELTALGADGQRLGPVGADSLTAAVVVIDRGGFGVRLELDQPRKVRRGANDTLLIQLIDSPTPASQIGLQYRLVPFGAK
ncbi:MAG: hypothetical protein NZ700_15495 [Gemmataceae bacterium]|nr:hypothetical protein [Gemmataceae bacterium]MDW8266086.1 hypothetical protein [Gemmataceae bacterium]